MQLLKILKTSIKHSLSPSPLINLILIPSSLCILYLLLSLLLNSHHLQPDLYSSDLATSTSPPPPPLSLHHIVFSITSNKNSFPRCQHYITQWWRSSITRGFVFLDAPVPCYFYSGGNDTRLLPPIRVSEDTSGFSYTNRNSLRSAAPPSSRPCPAGVAAERSQALCSRCPGRDLEESGCVGSDEDGGGCRPASDGRRPEMGTSVRWSRVLCEALK